MPLYMTQFAYTAEAWATLSKNPQDRTEAIGGLISKLGGRLLGLYYTFGEYDGFILYEAPDDTTAAAGVIAAVTPGHIKANRTTRVFTAAEAMEIMRKAGSVSYQAPTAR